MLPSQKKREKVQRKQNVKDSQSRVPSSECDHSMNSGSKSPYCRNLSRTLVCINEHSKLYNILTGPRFGTHTPLH